jgi:hypothetical protein
LRNAVLTSAETNEEWTEQYERLITENRAEINGRKDRFWPGDLWGRIVQFHGWAAFSSELRCVARPDAGRSISDKTW